MDLRAIINNEAGEDKVAAPVAQQPATPSSSSHHPQSRHASSANANRQYTEYSNSNSSAGRQPQHYDYDLGRPLSRNTSASGDYRPQFASPTAAYQRPQLHPGQVPLPHSNSELLSRSPRAAAPYPSQSPSFPRTSSGPFSYQATQSPGQERFSIPHQHSGSSLPRQESYPQPSVSQYLTSPVPLTPPSVIGPSGAYPPYLQQQQHSRSLSSHSNSTPTSAHSQYNQSPLLASAYPGPAYPQHQQQSQPGTPLGPPISIHRSGTYPQHQGQYSYSAHAPVSQSPHQGRQPITRPLSNPLLPHSQFERRRPREQSESISPRTTPDHFGRLFDGEVVRSAASVDPTAVLPARASIEESADTEGGETTVKMSPEQQQRREPVKREAQTPQPQQQKKRPQPEESMDERPRKRKRYTQETMPIWARSWPDFVKFKKMYPEGVFHGVPVASIGGPVQETVQPQVNGNASQQHHINGGRVPSSAAPQHHTNGGREQSSAAPPPPGDDLSALFGLPFAPNINAITPPAPITKQIADFLYVTVIARGDWNQLMSHKIAIEVEAKLGTLIDKSTNQRLELPIASEAVLTHGMSSKVAFRSEMQEEVFKKGNQFLNDATRQSLETPARVDYKHRKEVDSFHHLPGSRLNELPPAMQSLLNTPATRNRGLKVRVSHDQKTGKEIARIVKARVADLDVYFPTSQLDCRISVNLEMDFEGDLPIDAGIKKAANDEEGDRRKDRLSYKQSGYTIDLTQVFSGVSAFPRKELRDES